MSVSYQTISWFDNVISFRLPSHWLTERTEEGGAMFYAPEPGSGTLRMDMLTYRIAEGQLVSPRTAMERSERKAQEYGVEVQCLQDGVAVVQYDTDAEENGEPLRMRFWHITQSLPPEHMRIVIFSYTLLARQFDEPMNAYVLRTLDRELTAVQMASTL